MAKKYTKQWTNAEHTTFDLYQNYDDGRSIKVSPQQDVYLRWLAEEGVNNIPDEKEYIAPPPPPPLVDPYASMTSADRVLKKVEDRLRNIGYTDKIIAVLSLNKITNRNPEEFDAMNAKRLEFIEQAYAEEVNYQ